jgi:hypothetical protein
MPWQPVAVAFGAATQRGTWARAKEFPPGRRKIYRKQSSRLGERRVPIPLSAPFNTLNSKSLVNPLTMPGPFNFDGFLKAWPIRASCSSQSNSLYTPASPMR